MAYDATRRKERAQQQHTATLDAALALFLERGYLATTVESIANAADVSPATIYKTYRGKAGLLRDLCQRALAGSGPVPAEERSDALRSVADPRLLLEGWGRLAAEVSPRVSPLLLLLRTAAQADADAAALYDELGRARMARMADNARALADHGHLRDGVRTRDARDVLWFCTSPELYDVFVVQRRWSLTRFSRFLTATMINELL